VYARVVLDVYARGAHERGHRDGSWGGGARPSRPLERNRMSSCAPADGPAPAAATPDTVDAGYAQGDAMNARIEARRQDAKKAACLQVADVTQCDT